MPQANVVDKPYSDYRQPTGVSPYMDLFRTDRIDGVDNYNSLVKPRLDQQRNNRQVGNQVRGLQRSSQRQGSAIRSLGQETRAMQGRGGTQYFQNYGGYYPGLQR